MDFHTTQPELANPFADTADDPREVQRLVLAAMQKATRRRAAGPAPKMYWEEPGLHGTGREISLRNKARAAVAMIPRTQAEVRKVLRLPPIPKRKELGGGAIALIAGGVIVTGLLAGYLVGRRKRATETQVGDDVCGFDLLGCGS